MSIIDLFEQVDELHNIISLSGFEMLLRGTKVVTYGIPFYADWGLTKDCSVCERITKQLTLEELAPANCKRITCEETIEWVGQNAANPIGPSQLTRLGRLIKRVLYMM